MYVILSSSVVWAVAKDVEVTKKAWTASMMARKSQVDIVIWCGGGDEVLGPATSTGVMVLGARGSGGAEYVGVVGNGVGTKDAET